MESPSRQTFKRNIAIDAHKSYVKVGGLSPQLEVVLPLRKVPIRRFPRWAQANLEPTDAVVTEATTNTWELYDIVIPLVGKAVVAHPAKAKAVTSARVKTDKTAVWALVRLLVADLVPEVWVPPHHVRELRALVSHRRRLVHSIAPMEEVLALQPLPQPDG